MKQKLIITFDMINDYYQMISPIQPTEQVSNLWGALMKNKF